MEEVLPGSTLSWARAGAAQRPRSETARTTRCGAAAKLLLVDDFYAQVVIVKEVVPIRALSAELSAIDWIADILLTLSPNEVVGSRALSLRLLLLLGSLDLID